MPQQVEPQSAAMTALLNALYHFHGIVTPGNINLTQRPKVKNPDGSYSTVDSWSFGIPGGRAVLVPSVIRNQQGDWVHVTDPKQAWAYYQKTGQHLGIFQNEALANKYGELLHRQQAAYYEPVTA